MGGGEYEIREGTECLCKLMFFHLITFKRTHTWNVISLFIWGGGNLIFSDISFLALWLGGLFHFDKQTERNECS